MVDDPVLILNAELKGVRRMPSYRKKPETVSKLTPEQYLVARIDGTEHAFGNEYLENKHPGLYIGAVSGEPLLASFDKLDNGTVWSIFTENRVRPPPPEVNFTPSAESSFAHCARRPLVDAKAVCKHQSRDFTLLLHHRMNRSRV